MTRGSGASTVGLPPSAGIAALRTAVSTFYREWLGLDYPAESVLITGGARPAIYGAYRTLVDPGDRVVYPVPSWNNNHYCHLSGAEQVVVPTHPENNFMPLPQDIAPHLKGATLLCLCTPQNPTGTTLEKDKLEQICDLVLKENNSRSAEEIRVFSDHSWVKARISIEPVFNF